MSENPYRAYVAATQTVARTRQIVMLYDGAIRFVQQAREAIVDGRIEDRYRLLTRASDIIMGLQSCLDFDKGGDIAKILYQFYASIDARMFSVHQDNSLDSCDRIIADLKNMRDAWHAIDTTPDGAAPSSQQPLPDPSMMQAEQAPVSMSLSA